jgi:Protein of unknown function (DUF2800)
METGHSMLSPSKRYRWASCPGSIREEAKYPPSKSGAGAVDGTHTHTVLDWCIKKGLINPIVGATMTDHEGEFTIDDARAERVRFALEYIKARKAEVEALYGPVEVIAEERVEPAPLLGRFDLSGTVDVQIIAKDYFEVIDLKDGMNPVKAEGNHQMQQYACGILAKLWATTSQYDTKVRLTIIQPKARIKGGNGIETADYTVADVKQWALQIIQEAKATDDPNAPLVPGEAQCKYCPHKACSARTQQALEASGISFSDLSQTAADKQPTELSNDEIRSILEAAPLIRQMIEGAEAEAMRRFETGNPISGLKVIRGRGGNAAWKLEQDEMLDKLKRMGVPKSELLKTTLISPTQVKKLHWVSKKRDGTETNECLSERQIKTLETEYITKANGALKVVPEAVDGAPVEITANHLFSAVESPVPAWLAVPDWLK